MKCFIIIFLFFTSSLQVDLSMGVLNEIVDEDQALKNVKSKYAHKPIFDKNFYDLNRNDEDFVENFDRILAFNLDKGFDPPLDILEQNSNNTRTKLNHFQSSTTFMKHFDHEQDNDYYQKMHCVGKYKNESCAFDKFRFSEETSQHMAQLRANLIKDKEKEVVIHKCYASSQLVTNQDISWGMPCPDGIAWGGKMNTRWISSYLDGDRRNMKIEFRGSFTDITRLTRLEIEWEVAPQFIQILYTLDGKIWMDYMNEAQTQTLNDPNKQNAGKSRFKSNIELPSPKFITAFKLYMRGVTQGNRIFMTTIKAFHEQFTFSLSNMFKVKQGLAKADPNYFAEDQQLLIADIQDSIVIGDGREIFYFDTDYTIHQYVDDYCLQPRKGQLKIESKVTTGKCQGKEEQKWEIIGIPDLDYVKVYSQKDEKLCLSYYELEDKNLFQEGFINASNTVQTVQHNINFVFKNDDLYWRSDDDIKQVVITTLFNQPRTIGYIQIIWNYPPKSYQIMFLGEDNIYSAFHVDNNFKESYVELDFVSETIFGIKLQMNDWQSQKDHFYGIKQLIARRNGDGSPETGIRLENCTSLDLGINKKQMWKIHPVTFIDLTSWAPYEVERSELKQQLLDIMKNVETVIQMRLQTKLVSMILIKRLEKMLKEFPNKSNNYKNLKKVQTLKQLHISNKEYYERDYLVPSTALDDALKAIGQANQEGGEVTEPQRGVAPVNPGAACFRVKLLMPYKKSGYFWIKSPCSDVALRVYCDFDVLPERAFTILTAPEGTTQLPIKKWEDVNRLCAGISMEAAKFLDAKDIKNAINIINDLGIDLRTKSVIPIAYDPSCYKKDGCEKQWRSFWGPSSPDLSSIVATSINMKNLLNHPFAIGRQVRDGVGLGMHKSKFLLFKIGEFPINGIICSSNKLPNDTPSEMEPIKCTDAVKGNELFDGVTDSQIKVLCPKQCKDVQAPVYGGSSFQDTSSICRAAILSGAIEDASGGEIMVVVGKGKESYKGAEKNEIKGIDKEGGENELSFTILPVKNKCPQKKYQDKDGNPKPEFAFLETSETIQLSTKSILDQKSVKSILHLKKKVFNKNLKKSKLIRDFRILNSKIDQVKNHAKLEMEAQSMSFLEKSEFNDYVRKLEDLMHRKNEQNNSSQLQSTQLQSSQSQSSSFIDIQNEKDDENQKDENEEDDSSDSSSSSEEELYFSQDVIKYINLKFEADQHNFINDLKLVQDAMRLIEIMTKEIASVHGTSEDPKRQIQNFKNLYVNMQGTLVYIQESLKKAESKRENLLEELNELLVKKIKYTTYDDYKEEYYFKLEELWRSYDGDSVQGDPSNWEITQQATNKHKHAIAQNSQIFASKSMPSVLIFHYKYIFDFRIHSAVMFKDNGQAGFVFNYKDEFNYYGLTLSMNGIQYYLIENGKFTLIDFQEKRLLANQWYRVWVQKRASFLTVKVDIEIKEEMEEVQEYTKNEQPLLFFEAENHNQKSGKVGLLSNGTAGAYFDLINIQPIICKKLVDPFHKYTFAPEKCNRFRENYKGGPIELRWEQLEPEESEDGPGKWIMAKNQQGRSKVILQTTKVWSKSQFQDGTRIILQDRKCDNGHISFEFFMISKGSFSFLFRYQNPQKFYMLRFKPDGTYLYRALGGAFMEVSKDTGQILEKRKWYRLQVTIDDIVVKFQLKQQGLPDMFQLFKDEKIDFEDIHSGTIGFESFRTEMIIDEIRTAPSEDIALERQWASGGENGNSENQDDQEGKDKIKDLENGNGKIGDIICIKDHQFEDRVAFCEDKFKNDNAASNDCMENFCNVCCYNELGEGASTILINTCQKSCDLIHLQSRQTPWTMCQDSYVPNRSLGHFCERNYLVPKDQSNCKISMCNLCCVTITETTGIPVEDDSMTECFQHCIEYFSHTQDVVLAIGNLPPPNLEKSLILPNPESPKKKI